MFINECCHSERSEESRKQVTSAAVKNRPRHIKTDAPGEYNALIMGRRPFFLLSLKPCQPRFYWADCLRRRERQSAIMAINSLLVGLPLMLETV